MSKKLNKERAEKMFASNALITSDNYEYDVWCELGIYRLNISMDKSEIKKFRRNYTTPSKKYKFIDILLSISKEFDGGTIHPDEKGRKAMYLRKGWDSYNCEFEKIPTPVDKWMKILSQKFPNYKFTLSRQFHSSSHIGFENGKITKDE